MEVLVRNDSVELTLRLFLSISVVMNLVPMLLRQFRRLAQGHCSCIPTHKRANFVATPMKKYI